MISHVLVAVDGSTPAMSAVDLASDLASKYEAKLTLMYVVKENEVSLLPKELLSLLGSDSSHRSPADVPHDVVHEILSRAETRAKDKGVKVVQSVLEAGDPATRIVKFASDKDVSMIVMGHRGLSDLQGVLIGSVSHKVLHLASCPCLTVK